MHAVTDNNKYIEKLIEEYRRYGVQVSASQD